MFGLRRNRCVGQILKPTNVAPQRVGRTVARDSCSLSRSPFKFLDAYQKEDRDRFFGRERETAQLYNAVRASNLVLVTLPRAGEAIESGLMLTGRGRGHGVGLCQNGCHAYALFGWSAAEILAHYYPGSALVDGR